MVRRTALVSLIATLAFAAPASAATIHVNTQADSVADNGTCGLREAMTAATNNAVSGVTPGECAAGDASGSDTIDVPAGTYVITSQLVINSAMTIQGAGSATTMIDANGSGRVFNIGTDTTIDAVTIKGGRPVDNGGGIWHSGGTLTLSNSVVTDNQAGAGLPGTGTGPGQDGWPGGGIYATADVNLINTTVSGNRAGAGGPGASGGVSGGYGGTGGRGGGIYMGGAKLTLTNSIVNANTAGGGGVGGTGTGADGQPSAGGDGGGIAATGETVISGSTISNNAGGQGGDAGPSGGYTFAGGGGFGGGIWQSGGTVAVTDSTITANRGGHSGATGSGGANALGGGGGLGGGILLADSTTLTLTRSTVSDNRGGNGSGSITNAGYGGHGGAIALTSTSHALLDSSLLSGNSTGTPGTGASGGAGGYGGGVFNDFSSTLTVANTTITGNHTNTDGSPNSGQTPDGGGIYNGIGSTTTLVHATIAGNSTGTGGLGGGIASKHQSGSGAVTVTNSIIAGNSSNCSSPSAAITDGGHNVTFGDTTCPGLNADPKLGALADNGGPTKTMALGEGSAAIDYVPTSGAACEAKDQRGITRPQRTACDSGAFELEPLPVTEQPPSGGQNPPPSGGTTNPPPADKTAPTVKFSCNKKQKLRTALKKGLQCVLTTNEPGSAKLSAAKLCSGKATMTVAGKRKIACKFTKKARKKFAKAKRLKLKLVLVVKDAAGNQAKKTLTLTLKR